MCRFGSSLVSVFNRHSHSMALAMAVVLCSTAYAAAPNAPTVSGVTPTNDDTPTWSWTANGGGNGTFRYSLDGGDWAETTSTSYTPASALSEAAHTLDVQERDTVGDWSASGSLTITVDITGPTVTVSSLVPMVTDTTPLCFSIVLSEPVGLFWPSYMTITNGTSHEFARPTETSWFVYVQPDAEGDVTLAMAAGVLQDAAGNPSTADSCTVRYDITSPSVLSFTRLDPASSSAAEARYGIQFSEAVTGVDADDFEIAIVQGDALSGVSINGVTGSGDTYTVTLGTGDGYGIIGLSLADDDSITDAADYPLGGVGAGNGDYTAPGNYAVGTDSLPVAWAPGALTLLALGYVVSRRLAARMSQ